MTITFFVFENIIIKIDRPIEVMHRDADIGNRARELLTGIYEEDNWTRDVDKLFKKHTIKFWESNKKELVEWQNSQPKNRKFKTTIRL